MQTTLTSNHVTGTTGDGTPGPIQPDFGLVAVDLYRDIHKGIRAELFAITATAGSLDPGNRVDRTALADHVVSVGAVLESHAHHEDAVIDPVLVEHLPALAEQIQSDHEAIEARFAGIVELATTLVGVDHSDQRRLAHLLHLELATFTGAYLVHQDLEERQVMPELERRVGVDAVIAMHGAIVGSIPPDEMARSLAFMLPAMNVFDRVELLDGIRLGAPAPVFDGVVGLARSVLRPDEFAQLAARIGVA